MISVVSVRIQSVFIPTHLASSLLPAAAEQKAGRRHGVRFVVIGERWRRRGRGGGGVLGFYVMHRVETSPTLCLSTAIVGFRFGGLRPCLVGKNFGFWIL